VDSKILRPSDLWKEKEEYNKNAKRLARLFVDNLNKYPNISEEIKNSGPSVF